MTNQLLGLLLILAILGTLIHLHSYNMIVKGFNFTGTSQMDRWTAIMEACNNTENPTPTDLISCSDFIDRVEALAEAQDKRDVIE